MKKFNSRVILWSSFMFIFVSTTVFFSCMGEASKEAEEQKIAAARDTLMLDFEEAISQDRQQMSIIYGEDFRWYECAVVTKDYFDDEKATGEITNITNLFQVLNRKDGSIDIHLVYLVRDTTRIEDPHAIYGRWIAGFPLNEETIHLNFEEAYKRMMESNYPKPHSRYCVLRKQMGPIITNPQFIFGNAKDQIYVDAVTGGVTDLNPSYKGVHTRIISKIWNSWPIKQ